MPKVGMEAIRREQIRRAAATVIAREGFAGTTMRMVAGEAGVSTGMLNHYFANRQDLLTQTFAFVSDRAEARVRSTIEGMSPGRERVVALLDSVLTVGRDVQETWRVWINAYGEAVRSTELRRAIERRQRSWYALIDRALEGLLPPEPQGAIPWARRFDALLNGLTIQELTSDAGIDGARIRDNVLSTLFEGIVPSGAAALA